MRESVEPVRPRLHPFRAGLCAAAAALLLPDWAGWAQESSPPPIAQAEPAEEKPLAYEPAVAPSGDARLDAAMERASTLFLLRERAPTPALGLIARAQRDARGVLAALRSEGYYDGTLGITLNGEPPEAPGLADRLSALPGPVPVRITAEKGAQYRIGQVSLRARPGRGLEDEAAAEAALAGIRGKLAIPAQGEAGRAEPVLAAATAAVQALRDAGHPFAELAGQDAEIDTATKRLDVSLFIAPGPFARYGTPSVSGQTQVSPALSAAITRGLAGRPAAPAAMDETRRKLLALGVFDAVRGRAAGQLGADGRLPVNFELSDRPRRAIGFSAAYETRYGPSLGAYWEHRNLFGGAEKLRLSAEVSRLGEGGFSSSSETMNGKVSANLRKPWLGGREQSLVIDLSAVRERLDAYDRDAAIASVQIERRLVEHLTLAAGPFAEISRITQDDATKEYRLLGLNGTLRWDDTDSALDPSRGHRASATLSPTWNTGEGDGFLRLRLVGSTYLDLSGDKGSILALRGAMGTVLAPDTASLPADRRFYAGGGGSVRGYGYQRIGPRDGQDNPTGGFSSLETSIELRQRVSGPWGMVAFLDGGAVSDTGLPKPKGLSWGAGLGLRYATGIGPIRFDLAVPLDPQPGDAGYGIYIGIGQAF